MRRTVSCCLWLASALSLTPNFAATDETTLPSIARAGPEPLTHVHPAEINDPLVNPYCGWGIWAGPRFYDSRPFSVDYDTKGAGQMNGFFLNEGWMGWNNYNAYVAGNNAHELNGPGDCQPYAADPAWSCLAGGGLAAGTNSVVVRADLLSDFKGLDTHELEMIVMQGRGLDWNRIENSASLLIFD